MVNYSNVKCVVCCYGDNEAHLLLCDGCDRGFHIECLNMPRVPDDDWFCARCVRRAKESRKRRRRSPLSLEDEEQSVVKNSTVSTNSNRLTVLLCTLIMILTCMVVTKVDLVSCSNLLQQTVVEFYHGTVEQVWTPMLRKMYTNTTISVREMYGEATSSIEDMWTRVDAETTLTELWWRGKQYFLK